MTLLFTKNKHKRHNLDWKFLCKKFSKASNKRVTVNIRVDVQGNFQINFSSAIQSMVNVNAVHESQYSTHLQLLGWFAPLIPGAFTEMCNYIYLCN